MTGLRALLVAVVKHGDQDESARARRALSRRGPALTVSRLRIIMESLRKALDTR